MSRRHASFFFSLKVPTNYHFQYLKKGSLYKHLLKHNAFFSSSLVKLQYRSVSPFWLYQIYFLDGYNFEEYHVAFSRNSLLHMFLYFSSLHIWHETLVRWTFMQLLYYFVRHLLIYYGSIFSIFSVWYPPNSVCNDLG